MQLFCKNAVLQSYNLTILQLSHDVFVVHATLRFCKIAMTPYCDNSILQNVLQYFTVKKASADSPLYM